MPEVALVSLAFAFGGSLVREWYLTASLMLVLLIWGAWLYLEKERW